MLTNQTARRLLLLQVVLLLIGTLMPGAWRATLESSLHPDWGLSSLGHFVLFAGMAWVASGTALAWPWQRIVLAGLVLALLTEGLQFFAIERHPRWVDVGIDMAGLSLGLLRQLVRIQK